MSLQRGKHPLRRTPVRRVSAKRARANRIYSAKRKAFLAAHPWCQWHLTENGIKEDYVREVISSGGFIDMPRSTEIHHKAGRTGTNFLDESTWMAVGREGHEWIHSHLKEARTKGYVTT